MKPCLKVTKSWKELMLESRCMLTCWMQSKQKETYFNSIKRSNTNKFKNVLEVDIHWKVEVDYFQSPPVARRFDYSAEPHGAV